MPKMKDSGVKWLGLIPLDWEIKKAKYSFKERMEKGNNINLQLLSPTQKYGVIPQEMYQEITGLRCVQVGENANLNTFKTVHKNDFCISLSAYMGGFEYSEYEGVISPAYHSFYKTNASIYEKYYKYLFKCLSFIDAINVITPNSVRVGRNTSFESFGNLYIPIPPINTQKNIADFLEKKCSEIDSLYLDIEKQIETLEEYKKSVITKAVTKGLNSDVHFKSTNLEWIDSIPQHWEISKIKYLFNNAKGLPITKDDLIDEGTPVISYGQIHSKDNSGIDISPELLRFVDLSYQQLYPQCEVFKNDFIFADTSEDYNGCGNCVYKRDDSVLFAGYHSIILHSKLSQDNRYFAYLFKTDAWRRQIREIAYGVKVFSITQKTLINTYILVPSFEEQQVIANYLDDKCHDIDTAIANKKAQLKTLTEYKKSLIYEYVTGKKEVPENV